MAIDTTANLTAMGVALQAAGCERIIVLGDHYKNFSSGGDTHASPLAAGTTLRAKQLAAATALSAEYISLWTYMDARIVAGTDTQGNYAQHVADSNNHLNAYGEGIVAQALFEKVQATAGWIEALS